MLDFKIKRGPSTAVFVKPGVINPKLIIEPGCWYLCTDTAELFVGVLTEANKLTLKRINDDSGHITDEHIIALIEKYYKEHPETDPTISNWAKQPDKPSYTAAEVGAVDETRKIANISLNKDITAEELREALDFQETDPTVPSWAKQSKKPTYTTEELGAVPVTRKIAGLDLTEDITAGQLQEALDVTIDFTETDPTVPAWAKQSEKPTYTAKEVGALSKTDVEQTFNPDSENAQSGKAVAAALDFISLSFETLADFCAYNFELGKKYFVLFNFTIDSHPAGHYYDVYLKTKDVAIASFPDHDKTQYYLQIRLSDQSVSVHNLVDSSLDFEEKQSTNPVQNKAIVAKFEELDTTLSSINANINNIDTALDKIEDALETSVVVLKTNQTTSWETSDYILLSGEIGIGYLENGNVIVKAGDGEQSWKDLPQIDSVLEDDIILTYDFGKHKINNGFVNTGGKGMTTSQWLIDALSEVKEPKIIQPEFTLTASAEGSGGEIGTYITALKWDGNTTYGSYEYGPATGLGESNRIWSISNDIDDQTATTEDGTFNLATDKQIQLTQEASKTYASITGTYTLDASSATTPVNNVGTATAGKITDKTGTLTADITATAYRKPFYGVLEAGKAIDISALTSDIIRTLPKSGSFNKGLPSSIDVPIGSQMVIFAVKADTYKALKATDNKAMNAEVGFTKLAKAVKVEGANNFEAIDYDIWYVDWNPDNTPGYTGIGSAKQLKLTWT